MGPLVIVGAGAIGTWLAVYLSQNEDEVVLFARAEQAAKIREAGAQVELLPGLREDSRAAILKGGSGLRVIDRVADLPKRETVVLFAVRAYQTREAATQLSDAGVDPAGVVTLQNGLGNAEALAEIFAEKRVTAGTTSHGVTLTGAGRVRHTGWGEVVLGAWTPHAKEVASWTARRLEQAGIDVQTVGDPRSALWRKVAVNAAINPPTALHRIENGALLDGGALEADLRAVAREVARVAQAQGVPLDEDEAQRAALQVARRTARNRSSMLQALEAGRPLETDAITGEVVRRAEVHGVEVPVNRRHLEALASLIAGKTRRTPRSV